MPRPAAQAPSTSSQPDTLTTRATTSSCGRSQIFGSSSTALPASAIAAHFAAVMPAWPIWVAKLRR
jgi:hypothetical protein